MAPIHLHHNDMQLRTLCACYARTTTSPPQAIIADTPPAPAERARVFFLIMVRGGAHFVQETHSRAQTVEIKAQRKRLQKQRLTACAPLLTKERVTYIHGELTIF